MNFFQKVKKIFHYPFQLEAQLNEINWGLNFHSAIKDSIWFKKQALNPGRWALGYPALYVLYRVLSEMKPHSILEFGLGESTKMTYQYIDFYRDCQLLVIEHDSKWKDTFCQNVAGIEEYIKVVPVEKIERKKKIRYKYVDLIPLIKTQLYDLIIIDGPFGSKRDSRAQILDVIENDLLADSFVIIIDDSDRKGEKDTIKKVCSLLNKKGIIYRKGIYYGNSNTTVICSEQYRLFTSL